MTSSHYAQRAAAKRRREARMERFALGGVNKPKRRWKKGHGTHAKSVHSWSPFHEDGSLRDLESEGWVHVGAIREDG